MNIKCSWILEGAPAIASRTLNWEIKIGISNFQSTQSRAWENILTVIAFFSTTALTVIKAIGFWLFLSRGQTFSLTRSSGCYWKCGLFASCCFHGLCPEGSAGVCESCMALYQCLLLWCLPVSQPPNTELWVLNDVSLHFYSLEEWFIHCVPVLGEGQDSFLFISVPFEQNQECHIIVMLFFSKSHWQILV